MTSYLLVGGAGFIGSHLETALWKRRDTDHVAIYDRQFGKAEGFADDNLVEDLKLLTYRCEGIDVVIHLASNADIAAAVKDPTIDFYQGTLLTQNVLEACRIAEVPTVLYASGSGVYGDWDSTCHEYDPTRPVSPYGASKLAGEALMSAYRHMFGIKTRSYRFANVVAQAQTHGVGYDLMRKLYASPDHYVEILGDGTQRKHYLHVDDAISAMLLDQDDYHVVNVAPEDRLTVHEIAIMVAEVVGVDATFHGQEERRGWVGDVPDVLMSSELIRGSELDSHLH